MSKRSRTDSFVSFKTSAPTTSATAPMGRLMKKTLCHEMFSTKNPPTIGPAAVAAAEALTQMPTAWLSSSGGNAAFRRARVFGSNRAPNAPWIPRRRMTPSIVPTSPMATDVKEKPTTPTKKTRRRPK